MKSKKEIVDWLLENCLDRDGDLDISGLDFGDFDGNIYQSGYKCKGDIYQGYHKNKGSIGQSSHENKGYIFQRYHENKGNIYQSRHENKGGIYQSGHENKGYVIVEGEHQNTLKEITFEELREMGYIYKGDK